VLDRAFVRAAGRGAVAAQVASDDLVAFLQSFELETPVVMAA
jgi:hypothetical protein